MTPLKRAMPPWYSGNARARLSDIQANCEISVGTIIYSGQHQKAQLKPFFALLCFIIHYPAIPNRSSTGWIYRCSTEQAESKARELNS